MEERLADVEGGGTAVSILNNTRQGVVLQPGGLARCSQLLTIRTAHATNHGLRTFDIDTIETT